MKNQIKSVVSLTVICAVMSLLLAVTNAITGPKIAEQEKNAVTGSFTQVLPEGEDFKQINISDFDLPDTITEAYSEKNGGYVFKIKTSGYAADLILMCGVDGKGVVKGVAFVSGKETLGYEKSYGDKLVNATLDTVDGIDTVAGATKTTQAFKDAARDALKAAVILGGGTVEKTEEELFAEALDNALPAAEGKFTVAFLTDELKGIDKVYKADNDSGYVFVIGESFVATDIKGAVLSDAEADIKAKAEAGARQIINSKLTEISLASYKNLPPQVQKAFKTAGGNYVLEVRAAGYGVTGHYNASGEYIYINVSVTPEGKIISCKTISQKETQGVGDACANPEYYSNYNGKTKDSIGEVEAISKATVTSNAYQTAVSAVFDAVSILKGGAK